MYLKKLQVKNFKSFQDISIEFNEDINVLTGVNNAGKTTMLEAIALWHECFSRLIHLAGRKENNYIKGDYVLGNSYKKYFPYHQINSVRTPNFEDIFYQREKRHKIELRGRFENENKKELSVNFQIGQSGLNYVIELENNKTYNYREFNAFFENFPYPIGIYYASPVSAISQNERFITSPQIQDAVLNRQSTRAFRNRLYRLYNSHSESLFSEFITTLNYVLFNNQQKITLSSESHINKTVDVIFNFKIGERDTEKDISLLGSGSLQIMEILLNFYYPDNEQKDCNLVLLDEPDSHIHRAIQQRLLDVLVRFSKNQNSQVFLSTHNEALIRSASLTHLFHLDSKPINHYRSLGDQNLKKPEKIGNKHFSGLYPMLTNPVISSLGNSNGLDFVNAIEADYVIFVEGEDDARVIDILLRKGQINNTKRYAYWVLGGMSHILKEITHYETVFSAVKNEKTLWEKSVLFFDRDYLYDDLLNGMTKRLNQKLKTHTWMAYTFEATVFTDLEKLEKLLHKWLKNQHSMVNIQSELTGNYQSMGDILRERFNENTYQEQANMQNSTVNKINDIFGKPTININPHQLNSNIRGYIKSCLENKEYYRLMNKDDVGKVINDSLWLSSISFDIEKDFISLVQCADMSTWFDEWKVFNDLDAIG